jgi:putative ABC transport system substrate-binding protein
LCEDLRIRRGHAKYRAPAIYFNRAFVADGGLMSYGPDGRRPLYDAATYVDRILRRAKPGELPVPLGGVYLYAPLYGYFKIE